MAADPLAVGPDGASRQWLPATLFALPFVLLCTSTGALADRLSKSSIIKAANVLEIAVMAAATVALYLQSYAALLAVIFLMGAQSALFALQYGIVREIVPDRDMSRANALPRRHDRRDPRRAVLQAPSPRTSATASGSRGWCTSGSRRWAGSPRFPSSTRSRGTRRERSR